MTLQSTISSWERQLLVLAQDALCFPRDAFSAGSMLKQKQVPVKTYAACEAITAQHSRSFFLATSLLPGEKRRAMRVLYAFCRTADNLADGDVEQPAVKLLELRKGITGQADPANDAVLTAWHAIQVRYQIPVCYAEQLLDGVERDLVQRRYQTFEDLSVYCYGVASTVGLMSMHITGFSDHHALPYAIKLGVALQLTNILRDVGEDWQSDRLYLPLDELAAFRLDEQDVAAARTDSRWRGFMRFQIARARRLYAEAMPGIALLHPDGRFAVAAAAMLYKGILDDIEIHNFNVFDRRAHVSRGRKVALLFHAFRYANKKQLLSQNHMEYLHD
jgi:phytoene synthase